MITLRAATLEDAPQILRIYDHYVRKTAISFEYDTPTLEQFRDRMSQVFGRYPYLVAEEDGELRGYAYAHPFIPRAAYDRCCETTIYLDPDVRHRGIGKLLYRELEKQLQDMGILNMYACIGLPEQEDEYLTNNSADFHEHIGFTRAGFFRNCGYKFGRWYHMIWMEKIIGKHD